jgi:hypothetical protein
MNLHFKKLLLFRESSFFNIVLLFYLKMLANFNMVLAESNSIN